MSALDDGRTTQALSLLTYNDKSRPRQTPCSITADLDPLPLAQGRRRPGASDISCGLRRESILPRFHTLWGFGKKLLPARKGYCICLSWSHKIG